ncbi:MAG: hypothetical protein QM523_02675 [Candidatus Pacebacteria bacterium]|nr:hypothetical protein [Candidatus Paceibacterota bacterium]
MAKNLTKYKQKKQLPLKNNNLKILFDLFVILLLSYSLRLFVGYYFYNSLIFDEIFQIFEPAYYLAYGHAIMPWEYFLGIRSWLLPGILGEILNWTTTVDSLPRVMLLYQQGFLVILSMIPVVTGYFWGQRLALLPRFSGLSPRLFGVALAIMAGFLSENIFLASHGLTEVVAAWFVFPAVYFASASATWPWGANWRWSSRESLAQQRNLLYAGLFLGLALVLRFHLAPTLGVIALFAARGLVLSRWRLLVAGALIPIIAAAILDWVTLGTPLQSIWLNFVVNIVDKVSENFGIQPPWEVVGYPLRNWGWFAPLALYLAWRGGRQVPLVLVAIFAVLITHALIPHKEARFIYPILPLLSFAVAVGMVDFCLHPPDWSRLINVPLTRRIWLMITVWLLLSLSLCYWSGLRYNWFRGSFMAEKFDYISRLLDRPCGVALKQISFLTTPGNSGLPPSVQLYEYKDTAKLLREHAAFDLVLASDPEPELLAYGDRLVHCFVSKPDKDRLLNDFKVKTPVCLWSRTTNPGQCDASAAVPVRMGIIELPPERWQFGQKKLMEEREELRRFLRE